MNVLKRKNMYFSLISHCFVICKKNKKKTVAVSEKNVFFLLYEWEGVRTLQNFMKIYFSPIF